MKLTILIFATLLCSCLGQLRGVNYGIQRPDGSCSNADQVLADFRTMATFAQAAKIYNMGFCNGAEISIIAARATGLQLFLGMAAGPDSAFQNELSILNRVGQQYGFANVIGITVGSEDLYRGDVSADTIASQITQVKAAVKNLGGSVPVTHTDVFYMQPAQILAVEDIVMFNAFSFWEGVSIDDALNVFISHYQQLVSQSGGKTVWIGETGWPAGGQQQANAVASPANAGAYFEQFICWANSNGVPYFYFEAFDEPWKASQQNGAIEISFGIYNSDRTAKSYANINCPGPKTSTSTVTPTPSTSSVVVTSSSTVAPTTSSTAAPTTSSTVTPTSSSTVTPTPSTTSDTPAPSTSTGTPSSSTTSQVSSETSQGTSSATSQVSSTTSQNNQGSSATASPSTSSTVVVVNPSTGSNPATSSNQDSSTTTINRQQSSASALACSSVAVLVAFVLAL